jgi:subtilase family serine protease
MLHSTAIHVSAVLTLTMLSAALSAQSSPVGIAGSVTSGGAVQLSGHVPTAVKNLGLKPVGRLPAAQHLDLVVTLPFRNQAVLSKLVQEVSDPSGTSYRHYLSPTQFTERFCPTESEYNAVVAFVRANGLTLTRTVPDHSLVDVNGSVADIEKALHVTMRLYEHPTDARRFYAPDVEPSLDRGVPVLHISGLDNYVLPHPVSLHTKPIDPGSGSGGNFLGHDFRNAYAPTTNLTGAGQVVGLVEVGNGYTPGDITMYESLATPPLPNVPVVNVLLDGFINKEIGGYGEAAMDIELVISMAPGLSQVTVYEGQSQDDVLEEIANPTQGESLPNQVSSSWFDILTSSTSQWVQRLKMQGQSFFEASGDSGADVGGNPDNLINLDGVTVVGGTDLAMNGVGASWQSESCWLGSGGGFITAVPIPNYQTTVNMTTNNGSTQHRNFPDVAMVASGIEVVHTDPTTGPGQVMSSGGTSASAPLWAAFTALVNQQAQANGQPPVGFINPAIYAIGESSSYRYTFHDITTGNNSNNGNTNQFSAVPGYDLCTGWGTPGGQPLIDALAPVPACPDNGTCCGRLDMHGQCDGVCVAANASCSGVTGYQCGSNQTCCGTVDSHGNCSGPCVASNASCAPQLAVTKVLVHPWWRSLRLFNLQIDGVTVQANSNGGSTGPRVVSPGLHKVGETGGTGTILGDFYTVIGGDCAGDGTVSLAAGQSKACTITNYDNYGGCAEGSTCCEPGALMNACRLCVKPPVQCP